MSFLFDICVIFTADLCDCDDTRYKDHYAWNKATTCVHNLLGGQRWVDHYGEVNIVNQANGITCKLTYTKVSDVTACCSSYKVMSSKKGKLNNKANSAYEPSFDASTCTLY